MDTATQLPIRLEKNLSLKHFNSFALPARAEQLVRVRSDADVRQVLQMHNTVLNPVLILGGGSNLLLTKDVKALVLKVEIMGRRLIAEDADTWTVEAGAGENWHEFVAWTLEQGWPGLENLALIPGTVGASPVQNIGAYGLEIKDRLHSVDAVDLVTGRSVSLNAEQCKLSYRDSIFKQHGAGGLAGKSLITRVRFSLPKRWQGLVGYQDIEHKMALTGVLQPSPQQIFDWVCDIRRSKLPDPAVLPNAGSFFKNPLVSAEECHTVLQRDPQLVHYPLADGRFKLAAGWLIDACGWRGKGIGGAAVHERHALVLVNRDQATGAELMTLARAIQASVKERFGFELEPEPVVV
jgi:UDP-N-acetylmuramate dehydrogenase